LDSVLALLLLIINYFCVLFSLFFYCSLFLLFLFRVLSNTSLISSFMLPDFQGSVIYESFPVIQFAFSCEL